jgi:hypothetical protein
MGPSISKTELLTRMNSPQTRKPLLLFHKQDLSRAVTNALFITTTNHTYHHIREGLNLTFQKEIISGQEDVILTHVFGEILPEGPDRVMSLAGFMYLFQLLQELKFAVELLGKEEKKGSEKDEEDEVCPVCMDRLVDTVMACTHGICYVCYTEWLVGEGRETCPICRSKQLDGEDWVLNDEKTNAFDREDVQKRVDRLTLEVLTFLSELPKFEEYLTVFGIVEREDSVHVKTPDGIGAWLKGEVSFLKDVEKLDVWGRCPKCTTIIRVPPSAQSSAIRLTCGGCRSFWSVEDLVTI